MSLLPTVLLPHMRTCATGGTSSSSSSSVKKDHRTVFITDGKPGLKELIHIFTNVEMSECTFHMKVNLTKRLGGHKDKKAILGFLDSLL